METALVLVWDHAYDAVAGPGLGIARGLLPLGVDVRYVSVMKRNLQLHLDALEQTMSATPPADIVISVGAPPLNITRNDTPIWESVGERFFLYCLDSLIYDVARIRSVAGFLQAAMSSPRLGFMSPDRDNAGVIESIATCPYVPFAGTFLPIVRHERVARVAVIGTMGQELAAVNDAYSFEETVIATAPQGLATRDQLAEFAAALERPGADLNVITAARDRLGLHAEQIFTKEIAAFLSLADAYQKRRRRALAIAQLRDVPVDFYGAGWQPYTKDFTDCRHMGDVSYFGIPKICRQYKAMLNFDTNWNHGLHMRVHTGIGNGCRVITNTSSALADLNLPDADAVGVYDANAPVAIGELVSNALSLPAIEPERLLDFRVRNSWFSRVDDFMMRIS